MDAHDKAFHAYIFDLDGTLLDTLPDLVHLTNMVLSECGWPERSRDEVLSYVGNGGRDLLRRAAPSRVSDGQIDKAFRKWRDLYPVYGHACTKPYEGIPETLDRLKENGAKLGVLSNKFDAAVRQVIDDHFPGVFDMAWGECEEVPRKPDPTGLSLMLQRLGVASSQAVFVGDSATDMLVAERANVYSVGVAWGYQSVQALRSAKARAIVYNPTDLLNV